jgi:hypothetical protein
LANDSGGVAALNPLLMAASPPGCKLRFHKSMNAAQALPFAGNLTEDKEGTGPARPMTKEEISAVLPKPFRPFSVRLADGITYAVPAQDFAHLSPKGRLLTNFTESGNGVKILDVALVTKIKSANG